MRKGLGVKKDINLASRYFITTTNFGQPKAFYQLAKMFQKGIGLKKNFKMVGYSCFVFLYAVFHLVTSLCLRCLDGVFYKFRRFFYKVLYLQMIRFI